MSDQDAKAILPHSHRDDWLSAEEVAGLTVDIVRQRLLDISGLIAAHAAEAEKQRYPVEMVWSAIRKTGLFYLFVPRKFGGLGIGDIAVMIDLTTIIGEHCASTAWGAVQCLQNQWLVARFSERFQQEIWGSLPYLTAAGSAFPLGKATRVEGGYRLSARYRWGSGVMYSQWVFGFAQVDDPDGETPVYCMMWPIEQATVLDTWHFDGMCGSGSHDYMAEDVFIPEHRALNATVLSEGRIDRENPVERIPPPLLIPIMLSLPILGAARGAVKAYRKRLATGGPDAGPVDRPLHHACLARADIAVSIAELTLRDSARQLQDAFTRSPTLSEAERSRLRALGSYAAEMCKTALRSISDISGSSAHHLSNPLQRALRDVTILGTHVAIDPNVTAELYGRNLVGLTSEVYAGFQASVGPPIR
jgi:3-hydroxy-9,10-secoandrosta-1,3,5(10)-triene-9,17-dione monooxygenase